MDAVEQRYPLAQRWFRAKAGMLGLDVLELADQYAPLGDARGVPYDEGRALVDAAFAGFLRTCARSRTPSSRISAWTPSRAG